MKKNFSEGAIHKIPSNFTQKDFTRANDDMDIYEDCDQEYSVLDAKTSFNTKINKCSELSNLLIKSSFQTNNFSSCRNLKNLEENHKEDNLHKEFENLIKEEEKELLKNEIISEENSIDLKMKNGIMKNSQEYQMDQLDRIFKEMNENKEAKVIIKAYKSKLKTKFYKVYESNSEFYKEKNKFKIFHKCNFPGCTRTFASAGWLKSHFNEHLQDIKLNKFNIEFERSLNKFRYKKILN